MLHKLYQKYLLEVHQGIQAYTPRIVLCLRLHEQFCN